MLPFVPGFQCRCLFLVCACAFVIQLWWTSELGSFWTVPLDPRALRLEAGLPGRDHCCDVHGEAYLWNGKQYTEDGKKRIRRKKEECWNEKKRRTQQVTQQHQTTCCFSTYGADHFLPQWATVLSESQKNLTVAPRLHHMSAETWPVVTMVLFP